LRAARKTAAVVLITHSRSLLKHTDRVLWTANGQVLDREPT
jgi:ABC-type lipoprotein export system ATPase subunit